VTGEIRRELFNARSRGDNKDRDVQMGEWTMFNVYRVPVSVYTQLQHKIVITWIKNVQFITHWWYCIGTLLNGVNHDYHACISIPLHFLHFL
jgi:hypothetical protein